MIQCCSAGEALTHGHSVSSQALYHDSKSQSLNPENKLLYEMKKNLAAFFSQYCFYLQFKQNVYMIKL